jgi:hypothetical protein
MTASAWLTATRPSRAAIGPIRWRAIRGHSQTVTAIPATAAAIVRSMNNPLVSPMA